MADLDFLERSNPVQIVGGDEQFAADVIQEHGRKSLLVNTIFNNDAQVNALGVLRTTTPRVLFNKAERYDIEEDLYFSTKLETGATRTHDDDKVASVLSVTATTGSKAIRQTRRYFRYVKGSPQSIIITGNFKGAIAGITKMIGYYDEENGIFLRLNGTTPEVVIRSKISGTVTELIVSQNDWDDPLDGTGESGQVIDWSKQQLFYFDFAWLGIVDVRFGLFLDGKIVVFKTIKSSNIITGSWAQSAVLPLRFEIENVSGVASSMETTCYAINSEDGIETQEGAYKRISNKEVQVSVGTSKAIVTGIRINPVYKGNLSPQDYATIVPSGNSIVYFQILYNATLTGDTWEDIPNSIGQRLNNIPTFEGGFLVDEGYAQVGASSLTRAFKSDSQLGRGFDGQDTLILIARTLSGNSNFLYQLSWREDT